MLNRSAAITKAPQPGRLNDVLPVAPRGQIDMLADYIDPDQTFVTCPNQHVVYGLGFFSLHEEAGGRAGPRLRRTLLGVRALRRAHRPVRPNSASPTRRSPAFTCSPVRSGGETSRPASKRSSAAPLR
jgi:hypothetical protein